MYFPTVPLSTLINNKTSTDRGMCASDRNTARWVDDQRARAAKAEAKAARYQAKEEAEAKAAAKAEKEKAKAKKAKAKS